MVRNPLEVEVTLSKLTVTVREDSSKDVDTTQDFVDVEVVDDVTLGPRDTRTVSGLMELSWDWDSPAPDPCWYQMPETSVAGCHACNV